MNVTPSQTVGPFLSLGLTWPDGHLVVPEGAPGAVRITGVLRDGAGAAVSDGLVETWQADPEGHFDHPDDPRGASGSGFGGFGRCATDADGRYWFSTLKPGGPVPYIAVLVFARGLLKPVTTRLYFPGEAGNATDPVLARIPEDRRDTLVAVREGERSYRFDVHLQGERETVFFG